MEIIGSCVRLEKLYLEISDQKVAKMYLPQLLNLRHLEEIHLNGIGGFTVDHFQQITETCQFLQYISFPRGTPWGEEPYLMSFLKNTTTVMALLQARSP